MRVKAGDGCMPRPTLIKQIRREGGDGVGVHGGGCGRPWWWELGVFIWVMKFLFCILMI